MKRMRGLFGRLFLIFTGLLIGISFSFALSFHLFSQDDRRAVFEKNLTSYANYIAEDIGAPPNKAVIDEKSKEFGLRIAVIGPGFSYKSSEKMKDIDKLLKKAKKHQRKKHLKKRHLLLIEKQGYSYIFGADKRLFQKSPWPLALALILSLLFVMLAYHLVNRLFKPIHDIKVAASEYADGNFEYEVKKEGVGILKELSISIRDMAERIQTMLDAKREMLLAIAHELRTPITRAKLHLEFVDNQDIKAKLNEELNEMSQLVTDILDAEALRDGHQVLEKKETNIAGLIENLIERNFSKESRIELSLDKNVDLSVDAVKYSLVIKNLIDNGLHYGEEKPVQVELSADCLRVINEGQKIPDEDIKHLTEAFYRVEKARDRKSGGVGLGLYLVQKILQAHGQKLHVSSAKKTVFEVQFRA